MKFRVTQPFIAFGKTTEPGDVVELTDEQAEVLTDMDSVAPYEVKVNPPPENKKKPSASSRAARAPRKKTPRKSKKSVKK